MNNGEVVKPKSPHEQLVEWQQMGGAVVAALGFYGLAMQANNPTLAITYFNKATEGLNAEKEELWSKEGPAPTQTSIYGQALLNLTPIIREFAINKTISEPEEVKKVFAPFIRDLSKQSEAAKKVFIKRDAENEKLKYQQGMLISALNTMAVQGLLMYNQTDVLKDNEFISLPAFLPPERIVPSPADSMKNIAHLNIFMRGKEAPKLTYKLYIRLLKDFSPFHDFNDPEAAVVWVANDLTLPTDKRLVTGIDIIADLKPVARGRRDDPKVHAEATRRRIVLRERTDALQDAIDTQTVASITAAKRATHVAPMLYYSIGGNLHKTPTSNM